MNWKKLLQVLAAGAIAGAAQGTIGHIGTTPQVSGKEGWKNLGNASLMGAVAGALTTLLQTSQQTPEVPTAQ